MSYNSWKGHRQDTQPGTQSIFLVTRSLVGSCEFAESVSSTASLLFSVFYSLITSNYSCAFFDP